MPGFISVFFEISQRALYFPTKTNRRKCNRRLLLTGGTLLGCRCSPRFAEANSVDDESRAIERVGDFAERREESESALYRGLAERRGKRKEGGGESSLESSLGRSEANLGR